jgi:geranylgeranyl reductase family protein
MIVVIGAGPSGAWAAYSLAKRGARVTLVDPSHPREKPCGGGVTGRALALVADAIGPAARSTTVIRSARFTSVMDTRSGVDDRGAIVPLDSEALTVSSRASFDAALVAAAVRAGARLVPARVTDIVAGVDGVRVETSHGTLQASVVVGADGANSLVRRRVARPFRRDQLSIATGFFARGVTSEEILVELVADPPGYIWSFPRPDHLAIGVCAQADAGVTSGALRQQTAAWIRHTGVARGARLQPYSWPIPSLGARDFESVALAGPRWCLVGDAAGLVDPITREGIFFALLSGQWAAEAVLGESGLCVYATRVREQLLPELAHAARLRAGFFRPAFTRLLIDALQQSAAIRAVMIDLIAGRQSYATLKWRLLQTFEVGLAWRALLLTGTSSRRGL